MPTESQSCLDLHTDTQHFQPCCHLCVVLDYHSLVHVPGLTGSPWGVWPFGRNSRLAAFGLLAKALCYTFVGYHQHVWPEKHAQKAVMHHLMTAAMSNRSQFEGHAQKAGMHHLMIAAMSNSS